MPLPFDATLKDLVQRRPADFQAGFHLRGPAPTTVVNVDLSIVSAATDVVLAFGEPPQQLVDLNFQSGADESLVERLHLYNALLNYRYRVPVHTLLILLRPEADGRHLTGRHHYAAQGRRGRLDFRYEIVRLWRVPTRRLLRAGLGMLPLAMLGQLPPGMNSERALAGVVQRIEERALRETTLAEARQILTSAFFLTGARLSEDAGLRLFAGVPLVEESTTYQYVLRQGNIKGRHDMLLDQGRERFGSPDEKTIAVLASITDVDRLTRMGRRLLRVNTWEELLRTR